MDNDAIALFNARPHNKAKFLRLETNGLETATITKVVKLEDYNDPTMPLKVKKRNVLTENLAYRAAMTKCMTEIADTEQLELKRAKKLQDLGMQADVYQQTAKSLGSSAENLISNLPAEMTLSWRMWDLMRRDALDA